MQTVSPVNTGRSASRDAEADGPAVNHIAIIPDGNRRWAAEKGVPIWDGVRSGAKTAETTFEAIRKRRIPWCTFWASSYDNLAKRPVPERRVLDELYTQYFTALTDNKTVHRERVRVRVLGEWAELISPTAQEAIRAVLAATESYGDASLTFLVGYDGDRELASAATALMQEVVSSKEKVVRTVTIDDLRAHSWTKELPEVDVIIRTGAWEDPHRSANFLPLLTRNVQEAYPQMYWPDFSEQALDQVLADLQRRERRLGA